MNFRIRLNDEWRELHHKSSVRLSAVLALASPTIAAIREAWGQVPDDLKAYLPTGMKQALAFTILFGFIIALRYTTIERKPGEGDK